MLLTLLIFRRKKQNTIQFTGEESRLINEINFHLSQSTAPAAFEILQGILQDGIRLQVHGGLPLKPGDNICRPVC